MNSKAKKLLLTNMPYVLFVYPFDKVSQAIRLSPGADLSAKLLLIVVLCGNYSLRRLFAYLL